MTKFACVERRLFDTLATVGNWELTFGTAVLLTLAGACGRTSRASETRTGPVASNQTAPSAPSALLPESFVGVYRAPRHEAPEHTISVTPGGIASSGCLGQINSCGQDSAIAFSSVACSSPTSCTFTSNVCNGSLSRLADGSIIVAAQPIRPIDTTNAWQCQSISGPGTGATIAQPPPAQPVSNCAAICRGDVGCLLRCGNAR